MKTFLILMTFVLSANAHAGQRDLILTCRAPYYEGELQIYRERAAKYIVTQSGIRDFPTRTISSGPGGLYLEFIERRVRKTIFVPPSYGGKRETKAQLSLSSSRKVIQEFDCNFNL